MGITRNYNIRNKHFLIVLYQPYTHRFIKIGS